MTSTFRHGLSTVVSLAALAGWSLSARAAERPDGLQSVPVYDRSTWLVHSMMTADLVVVGTPCAVNTKGGGKVESARLEVREVLHGEIHPTLRVEEGGVTLAPPYRLQWDSSGIWIMLRTPKGYFAMNPTDAPLKRGRWGELEQILAKHALPQRDLTGHFNEGGSQIYRTYRDEATGKNVWHGTNVSIPGLVYTELLRDGKRVFSRSWDAEGRLRSVIDIAGEHGYTLQYRGGHLRSFSHYRDGKLEGLSRTFYTEKPAQAAEETHWRNGIRHGGCRRWDPEGKLRSEIVYEDGLIAPVVHYRPRSRPGKARGPAGSGKVGRPPVASGERGQSAKYANLARGQFPRFSQIHRTQFGVHYSASPDIMDALKVGMSTEKVSELLGLDFSERTGIRFNFYSIDTYLHISFKDGRISGRETGPNGIHPELRPDIRARPR